MINTENGPVYAPGIQARMRNQKMRVTQGVLSGQICKEELGEIQNGAKTFNQKIADAKGDNGFVSGTERKELHESLNKGSVGIYVRKHNGVIDTV